MFDRSMIRVILSRDGKVVSHLDDETGPDIVTDGIYLYRDEAEAVPDSGAGGGRPAKVFRRSVAVETLAMYRGIAWREVGVTMDFEPVAVGWCDDVLVGVCRASEDDSRMKINPTMLWRMYCSEHGGIGTTAKGITHRHKVSERHARRYMDKLAELDAMLVFVLNRLSQRVSEPVAV